MIDEYLERIDTLELLDKIRIFRNLDFKSLSHLDVHNELMNVLCFPNANGSGTSSVLGYSYSRFKPGSLFYRVRGLDQKNHQIPYESMCNIKDCWEPPIEFAKEGRLNKPGTTLLYTSPDSPITPIIELKIQEGELFSLIVYKSTKTINAINVARQFSTKELSHKSNDLATKFCMINDFIADEFRRDVGKGTEHLYKISQTIILDYFDHPPEMQDAWLYPSIASRGTYNVCFRPKMQRKIDYKATIITRHSLHNGQLILKPEYITIKKQGSNRLLYLKPNDELLKDLLPKS